MTDYIRLQHSVKYRQFFPCQNHPNRLAPRWTEVLGKQKLAHFLDTCELKKKHAQKLLTPTRLVNRLS